MKVTLSIAAGIALVAVLMACGTCPPDLEPIGGAQALRPPLDAITLVASQALTTTRTAVGSQFGCGQGYDWLTLWVEYQAGAESGALIEAFYQTAPGGDEFPERDWSSASGERSLQTANSYSLTVSGLAYINYEVGGFPFCVIYVTGGGTFTPSTAGTITVTYTLE